MRTKHLLWALALPAVFAACTNDDFESIVQDNNTLQGRPMAGNVELNFGFGDADTRLTTDFEFEVGDHIGATLMDEYEGSEFNTTYNIMGLPANKNVYTFVNYIQTNYRYTNTANGWENNNLLCSGNYFFYYPYMTTLNTRKAFEKYLNPNQVLTANTKEAGRQLIIDNQMYVGYKLVEGATEGSTQVLNVKMSPVFAYPYFEIMCTDAEPVTIEKIALQYIDKTKDMPLMAIVDPSYESKWVKTNVNGVDYVDFEKDPTSAVRMGVPGTDKPQLDKDAVIAARQIQVTFPEGTTTKNGSPVRAYMVIPAGDYTNGTDENNAVELLIYTNKGLVTADLSVAHENSGTAGGEYNVRNDVAMGKVSGTMAAPRVIKITFDEVAINNPDEFTTTSTEDLDSYVSWSAQIGGTKTMWVKSTNKDTELTAATVATLAKNQNITMNVLGDITIAKDVKSEDFDAAKINFLGRKVSAEYAYDKTSGKITGVAADEAGKDTKGQTVYNKATLTNFGDLSDPANGDLTIQNEGNMTLTGTAYGVKFINKGTMTINAGAGKVTSFSIQNSENEHLENYGALNINGNVNVNGQGTAIINNYANATINIAEGVTVVARIDNLKDDSKGCAYGKIVVNGTWTVFGNSGKNEGEITVNGSLIVPATGAKYENATAWEYPATPVNKEYTPNIINNGAVTNVTNNGNVKLMSQDVSYSSVSVTDKVTGKVNNTVGNNKITVNLYETIYCEISKPMTFSEVNEFIEDTQSKLVRFVAGAGTLTIDAETDETGKVTKVGNIIVDQIEIASNLTIATANRAAEARIYGEATNKAMTITIEEGVVATLGNGVKLKVGRSSSTAYGTITADGKLVINGSAELGGYAATSLTLEGTVENYGTIYGAAEAYSETSTDIDWTGNAATTAAK